MFRTNIRRTDCVGPILSHTWRPKSDVHWNQVITMRSRNFCTFTTQRSKWPRRFGEIDPENFAHVFYMPLPRRWRFFFFFLPQMWDPSRSKYPRKYKNSNIWRKPSKPFGNGLAGVQNFGAHLSKTAWALDTEWFGGDKLEAAWLYYVTFFFTSQEKRYTWYIQQ